jgi:hypothetical protein
MYFNIRNVPMFSGPYMITKVTHQISDNDFNTSFTGTRQPFYSLPKIDNFLQTLNIKILSTIQTKIQQREQQARQSPDNIKAQQQNVIANLQSQDTLTKSQDCVTQINPRYRNYTGIDLPQQTSVTTRQLFDTIKDVLVSRGRPVTGDTTYLLANIAFSFIYVDSGNNTGITGYENNYSTINLTEVYGDSFITYIKRNYFCVSRGANPNLPVASFNSFRNFIEFVLDRIAAIPSNIVADANVFDLGTKQGAAKAFAKQYILNYPLAQQQNVYDSMVEQDKLTVQQEMERASDIFKTVQTFKTN